MLFQQQMQLPADSELFTSESGKIVDEREDGEGRAEVIRQLLESRQMAFEKVELNSTCSEESKRGV